jgi:hypothetical protein
VNVCNKVREMAVREMKRDRPKNNAKNKTRSERESEPVREKSIELNISRESEKLL